jgi:hypothetical protein
MPAVSIYVASGTWTKPSIPAGGALVSGVLIGGGGGGGGASGSNTNAQGGGGGGGGAFNGI